MGKDRQKAEAESNRKTVDNVSKGGGGVVTYGQIIQLMHLQSGKFLTFHKTSAQLDRDALKVTMESKGGKAAGFLLKPSIKVRAEGGQVYYGDSIALASTKEKDYLLNPSRHPFSLAEPEPRIHEANIAPGAKPLQILFFARNSKSSFLNLQVNLPVRLYHYEAESFMQASSNKMKHLIKGEHLPYLKRVEGDYENARNFSGKSVWSVEYEKRERGGEIRWDTKVRVRHLPSGKYLAVDYHTNLKDSGEESADMDSVEYGARLVNEGNLLEEKMDIEQTVFFLRKVEGSQDALVSLGSNAHLEHKLTEKSLKVIRKNHKGVGLPKALAKKLLYLGWMQQRPKATRKERPGQILAFTSEHNDQDAFQILPIEPEDCLSIVRMLNYRDVAESYVRKLQYSLKGGPKDQINSASQLERENAMLRELIFQIVIGNQTREDDPFTIMGPSNRFQQVFGRDSKLMDALMEMVKAPASLGMSLGYQVREKKFSDPRFEPLSDIHSLACKALRHLFLDYPDNEKYFAKQGTENDSWISILISQVASPIGASDTLTDLISNNAQLLEENVDKETIKFFQELIGKHGPDASYMRYFTGICSCRGRQILSNQEDMLRHLYHDSRSRKQLLIEHMIFPSEKPAQFWESLSDKGAESKVDHGEFLGLNEYNKGFPQVYIYWYGNSTWRAGQDQLYFSPDALGLKTKVETFKGRRTSMIDLDASNNKVHEGLGALSQERLVKIEDLCWVLDPKALKKKVQGPNAESWQEIKITDDNKEEHENLLTNISNLKKLALYLEAQIDLFAEMSLDRSYNVINDLRDQFPHSMLISLVANQKLPDQIRASYAQLLLRLYIDCFPHEHNCGRYQFPDLLWVYSELKEKSIFEDDALPQFKLLPSHPMYNNPDEILSFKTSNKFHLMEDFISDFFIELDGCQVIEDPQKNIFTKNILVVLKNLLSFGFYGTQPEIKDLCKPMIATLDGREDRKYREGSALDIQPEDGSTERYVLEENSALVMDCKQSICEALMQINRLAANYSLQRALCDFKNFNDSNGGVHLDQPMKPKKGSLRTAVLRKTEDISQDEKDIVSNFQHIFTSEESKALDLDELSDQPLDTILLDLLMYESNALFHASLGLLTMRYTRRDALLQCIQNVKLVPSQEMPVYGTFEQLDLEVSMLRNFMQSSETWGVENDFSGLDLDTFKEVFCFLDNANQFMMMSEIFDEDISEESKDGTQPLSGNPEIDTEGFKEAQVNTYNQDLLFYLGFHEVLLTAIGIKFETKGEIDDEGQSVVESKSEESKPTLKGIIYASVMSLMLLVRNNKKIQEAVFEHMDFFMELFDKYNDLGISHLIIEILRGNSTLCEKTQPSLFRVFARELNRTRDTMLLEFFSCQIAPEGEIIEINQKLGITELLDPNFKNIIDLTGIRTEKPKESGKSVLSLLTSDSEEASVKNSVPVYNEDKAEYQTQLLHTFVDCSLGNNTESEGKLQKQLPSDDLIQAIDKMLTLFQNNELDLEDPGPRGLFGSMVGFLDHIFFDTPLQEPKNVGDAHLHDMLGRLGDLLENGKLDLTEGKGGKDHELVHEILLCLKNYVMCVHRYSKLGSNRVLWPVLRKPLESILNSETAHTEFRQVAFAVLNHVQEDLKSVVLHKKEFAPEGGEQGETFQLGEADFPVSKQKTSSRISLQQNLTKYVDILANNEQIKEAIMDEKLVLVDLLENVEVLTDPDDPIYRDMRKDVEKEDQKKKGPVDPDKLKEAHQKNYPPIVKKLIAQSAAETRKNKILFDDLVTRMKKFVESSFGDETLETASCTVFDILNLHLKRAKDAIDNAPDPHAQKKAKDEYVQKQNKLSELNIVDVVYEAISSDADSELGQRAFELGSEMLADGNTDVQKSIVKYAQSHDANGRFFKNMYDKIARCGQEIKEIRKLQKANKGKKEYMADEQTYEQAEEVLQFMQELCEGHNKELQTVLREQSFNRKSFNLVAQVSDFVGLMGKNQMVLRYISDREITTLNLAFDCLIEMMQGPCPENQELIAASSVIDVCVRLLSNHDLNRLDNYLLGFEARMKALLLLASCIEGRTDKKVHKLLAKKIEARLLDDVLINLAKYLRSFMKAKHNKTPSLPCTKFLCCLKANSKRDENLNSTLIGVLEEYDLDEIDDYLGEYIDNAALYCFSLRKHLCTTPTHKIALQEPHEDHPNKDLYHAFKELDKRLGSVEICWQNRIETMFFPMPEQANSLTLTTKDDFLNSVDLTTQESRLKGLFVAAPQMLDEMKILYQLQSSNIYMFVKTNYMKIKIFNFFMALNLNFVTLLGVNGKSIADARTLGVEIVIIVLAAIIAFGYLSIVVYYIAGQSQLVWMDLQRKVRETDALEDVQYTNFRPLLSWAMNVVAFLFVCVMHSVGFGHIEDKYVDLYLIFGCVIFGSNLITTLRSCLLVPKGHLVCFFVTIYDIFKTVKVASHAAFVAFAILGLYIPFMFTFLLFDVVSLSEDLKNTVRAVIMPIKPLLLTMVLFVIFILVFSQLGYDLFGVDKFCEETCEDYPDTTAPDSSLDMFWLILNAGTRYGDIGDIMTDFSHDDGDYYGRIFFLLAFFVILGVLLFNIITGIILDTFSSLREKTAEKMLNAQNECFISGVTREMYDEENLPFDQLTKRDQFLWNYVYFMLYLDLKDKSEFTGGEDYVWFCISKDDNDWCPTRTSAALEELKVSAKQEITVEHQIQELQKTTKVYQESTEAQLAKLSQQITEMMKLMKK